ncbi:MAG: tRNA guanosine(34) transglycosylase Tgt [Patescibacteria group bacterium]
MFEIFKKDQNSKARVGFLRTEHGEIQTPSYVVVGTNAAVRCLEPGDLKLTKTQAVIANAYHLWREANFDFKNLKNLYERTKWQIPTMTDSGGFQVFSLGFAREHKTGKIASINPGLFKKTNEEINLTPNKLKFLSHSLSNICGKLSERFLFQNSSKNLVRITNNGVYFYENDKKIFLDAKKSIWIQEKLGADIILAFDECTSPFHDYKYTKRAMKRTHKWALECLDSKTRKDQFLYGIVQGGVFEDLRKESAKFIGKLPFDGFAIGGSFGAVQDKSFGMDTENGGSDFREIEWVTPYLPEEKPRHLLGVGKIKDLFEAVERGIDTFDCVIPTREARHGGLWTRSGRLAIKKEIYKSDNEKLENECECPVCGIWKIRRKDLYELFKTRDANAARFATIHNVYFFNNLMERIRKAILENKVIQLKKSYQVLEK